MGCACTKCKIGGNKRIAPDDFSVVGPQQPEIVVTPADAAHGVESTAPPNPLASRPSSASGRTNVGAAAFRLDTSHGSLPLQQLPSEIKMVLFRFFAAPDFIASISLVSRGWAAAITTEDIWRSLWMERIGKLQSAGSPTPTGAKLPYRRLVAADVLRNMLGNPKPTTLADHQRHWRIVGGDSSKNLEIQETNKSLCWVAAKGKVHRKQVVNLEAGRFPVEIFDQPSPPDIWIAATWQARSATSTFRLRVRLMGAWQSASQAQEVVAAFDSADVVNATPGQWQHFTHSFSGYPAGTRYVCFEDWSKDSQVAGVAVQLYSAPPTYAL
eukprot:TRINITY_DN10595_c0_g1_i1.p1 TRINITY_DN10595_c0_g1~~TRINITY_DN10595_c0_g1_i1.p1  ORF type:complete len:326 (+),score=45.79 TRINITY_DN10595_c0_g1_i1:76-1053(+)